MRQITVRLDEDRVDDLDEEAAERDVSRSTVLRDRLDDLDDLRDRVQELEARVETAEARADDLRRQLRAARDRERDVDDLAKFAQDERRYRRAGIMTRLRWWVRGMDVDDLDEE